MLPRRQPEPNAQDRKLLHVMKVGWDCKPVSDTEQNLRRQIEVLNDLRTALLVQVNWWQDCWKWTFGGLLLSTAAWVAYGVLRLLEGRI